jgi:hypothetical protein
MRASSKESSSGGGILSSITSGLNAKKSFIKGFLSRGASREKSEPHINKSVNLQSTSNANQQRTNSLIGIGQQNMRENKGSIAMMMALKNQKNNTGSQTKIGKNYPGEESMKAVNKSYSLNRAFGKDITNKILNSSGAVALPNQTEHSMKPRMSIRGGDAGRKPRD